MKWLKICARKSEFQSPAVRRAPDALIFVNVEVQRLKARRVARRKHVLALVVPDKKCKFALRALGPELKF